MKTKVKEPRVRVRVRAFSKKAEKRFHIIDLGDPKLDLMGLIL